MDATPALPLAGEGAMDLTPLLPLAGASKADPAIGSTLDPNLTLLAR